MSLATRSGLQAYRDEIVREWETLASADARDRRLGRSASRDELPGLLDELSRWMERDDPAAAATLCSSASRRAARAVDAALPLPQLLREYAVLRAAILRVLLRHQRGEQAAAARTGRGEDLARLDAGLDLALSEAVARFAAERERRAAEREGAVRDRRSLEARYESLVRLSPDAILVHRNERIAFANPAAVELFGAGSARDLEGRSPYDLVHPDDRDAVRERVRLLLAGDGRVHRVEVSLLRRDGTTVLAEASARAFEDSDGQAIEVVLRDVTEHRRAEEALRATEERLRAHIDNSPLAVIEFDPSFTVTRWSKEAERVFGWTADEMIGRKIPEVRWVHEQDEESVRRESARLLSGEGTRTLNVNRNYRKDGSVVHCEWYSSALHDSQGRLISILSQVLDVTDRRRAEEALRAADQRKTEFLAVLSHELRNYLAPMKNGLCLLERVPAGSAQFDRAREIVARQMDHLTRLVDDLLDVGRINAGKMRLEPTRLDARDVVRRACDDVRAAFEERGVALRSHVAPEALWVDADESRLAQIVGNLLGNALKFTPPGGAVEVTLGRDGDVMALRVRDTGAGIDPRFLEVIFEQFAQPERTKEARRGGMGIGLALVRSLVTMQGGTVRARSEGKGKGAEFVVSLPLATAPAPRVEPPHRTASPGLAILLVEDDRDAAETLEQLLQMEGHRTRLAFDGRSGLEAFRELAPDVVISDIGLPAMSGYELIAQIRRLEEGQRVFAVALTGYAQDEDVEQARRAGFDAHLPKAAPLERLHELLAQAAASGRDRAPPSSTPRPGAGGGDAHVS